MLCMGDLGLRASDVAAITTDGVDLVAGVLRFHQPKQRDLVAVPMTQRLTAAIRLYLRRGRPQCASAALFVKHRAPMGEALKPIGIRGIVVQLRRQREAGGPSPGHPRHPSFRGSGPDQ